jgi:hypothetical protein
MMVAEVYRAFGIMVTNDNEADAVGLAHVALAMAGGSFKSLTAARRGIVSSLSSSLV